MKVASDTVTSDPASGVAFMNGLSYTRVHVRCIGNPVRCIVVKCDGQTASTGKTELSRDAIVERALAIADAEGLEAVTIRRIAQEFGVTPDGAVLARQEQGRAARRDGRPVLRRHRCRGTTTGRLGRAAARRGRRARRRAARASGRGELAFAAGSRLRRRAADSPSTPSTCCATAGFAVRETADIGPASAADRGDAGHGEPGRRGAAGRARGARRGAGEQARRAIGSCRPTGSRACVEAGRRADRLRRRRTTTTRSASTCSSPASGPGTAAVDARDPRAGRSRGWANDPYARQPARPAHPAARRSRHRPAPERRESRRRWLRRLPGVVGGLGDARRGGARRRPDGRGLRLRAHRLPPRAGRAAPRRAGRVSGPIPWSHEPNRGFLRALHALGQAAAAIGETDEAARCATFLADSDPEAAAALGS